MLAVNVAKGGGYETTVLKELGTPQNLWDWNQDKFVDGVYKGEDIHCLMGHNRFRTQGDISAEKAHPYEFEHVIGAHNGTIGAHITRPMFESEKFDIDSQRIFSQLNHDGEAKNLWSMIDDSQYSAAALTWWDKRNSSLNIVRNSQRPLHFALAKTTKTLFWASEAWMLRIALGRAGVAIMDVEEAEVNQHHQLRFWDGKINLEKNKVELKKWVPQTNHTTNYSTGYGKSVKKPVLVAVTVTAVDKQAPVPYVVLAGENGKEYLSVCVSKDQQIIFDMLDKITMNIDDGSPIILALDSNQSYEISTGENKGTRFSASLLISALKESYGEELNAADGVKLAPIKMGESLSTWIDGTTITGKRLRKALRGAANSCCCCGQTHIMNSSPEVVGSTFKTETDFVCGECNLDGWYEYFSNTHQMKHHNRYN